MSGTWRWPHQENFNCHASDLSFPALSLCSSLVSSPVFRRGDDEYLNISMIDSSGKVCGFRVEDETGSKGRCYSKITLLESLYPIGTFIGCHDWCVYVYVRCIHVRFTFHFRCFLNTLDHISGVCLRVSWQGYTGCKLSYTS